MNQNLVIAIWTFAVAFSVIAFVMTVRHLRIQLQAKILVEETEMALREGSR